jgi:hypothetical protein
MSAWVELLNGGILATAGALLMRYILIAIIVIWSLRADEAGRKHALALVRLLRAERTRVGWFGLHRARPSGLDPPSNETRR